MWLSERCYPINSHMFSEHVNGTESQKQKFLVMNISRKPEHKCDLSLKLLGFREAGNI